jgi:valyl-tRNA synthetase
VRSADRRSTPLRAAGEADKQQVPISRPNFVELCKRLVATTRWRSRTLFRTLGLSVDWSYLYTTDRRHCVRTSQQAFLANLDRGEAYQQDAPTLWDVDFRTAVAQAELMDKEIPAHTTRSRSPAPTAATRS